jgi:outer membrane protein assembly factor BamB
LAGGNGVLYGFPLLDRTPSPGETVKLKSVWRFDFDPTAPKTQVHRYNTNRREGPSNIYGMPVFDPAQHRLLVAGGGDLFWGKNEAWIKSVSVAGRGDVTTNALIWSYALEKHVLATPALYEGMVFIADCGRKVHCLDAATGKPYWTHDIRGEVWASPLVADGKVYLGTRQGEFLIFAAAREKKLLASVDFGSPITATATPANGVLYVATMKELFALTKGEP